MLVILTIHLNAYAMHMFVYNRLQNSNCSNHFQSDWQYKRIDRTLIFYRFELDRFPRFVKRMQTNPPPPNGFEWYELRKICSNETFIANENVGQKNVAYETNPIKIILFMVFLYFNTISYVNTTKVFNKI